MAVQLHYNEYGSGTPIVLLHGFPFSNTIWQPQQPLAHEYRMITPDLRGHGKSPAPEGVYEMEILADDVLALLDSLNISQAVIMGHSMGGYVTLAMWRKAPERFLALGLISSQASAASKDTRQTRYASVEKIFAEGNAAFVNGMLPRLLAPGTASDESYTEALRTIMLGTPINGLVGSLKGMAQRPDSTELLPGINVPSLLLCGERDVIIPMKKSETMAELIPVVTLMTVEDAGHMPMLEQPSATTTALRKFLNELPLRPR